MNVKDIAMNIGDVFLGMLPGDSLDGEDRITSIRQFMRHRHVKELHADLGALHQRIMIERHRLDPEFPPVISLRDQIPVKSNHYQLDHLMPGNLAFIQNQ
jgi:hypothetical protein